MRFTAAFLLAATLGLSAAQDVYLGFNSGATTDKGTPKRQADFEKEFETQQKLKSSPKVFNAARLYTNIQANSEDPIEAFPAAIKTNTKLLLGIWASGTTSIDKELAALLKAIEQHGSKLTDLIVGLSVGSEDLYRISEIGILNKSDVGADPKLIASFIKQAREKLKNTALKSTPIGHVDTWTAWINGSNKAVIDESDFLGTNLFPYYEKEKSNDISDALGLFNDAISQTEKASGGKPVWITETGWPVSGPASGKAKASAENAKTYWQTVGCSVFGKRNTWWYVLQDSNPANEAKFGITKDFSTTPQYNLSCPATPPKSSASQTATTLSSSATNSVGQPNNTGSPSGNPTGSPTGSPSGNPTGTPAPGTNNPANNTGAAPGAFAGVSGFPTLAMSLSMMLAVAAWAA